MRLLTNVLGSKRTLVIIIVLLLCVIIYLSLFQQGSVVCNDYASQQSKVEVCKCPSVSVEQRESRDYKMADGSNCGRGTQRRFPQAIIIGVRKAGTRALINMLKTHPDIFAALGEVHFFDRDENFKKGMQWYIEQMPCTKKGQITIEKSPSYFTTDNVSMRIKMLSSHTKLILIVRNPIDRAISDFTQLNSRPHSDGIASSGSAFEHLAFNSVTGAVNKDYNAIAHSLYDVFFQQWLKHFNLDQIHVVNGDILINNPVQELQMAEKFLRVGKFFQEDMFYFNKTKGFYCWKKANKKGDELPYCLGDGKGRQHPNISDAAIAKLKKIFQPHNERFYSLAHRNFDWDNNS